MNEVADRENNSRKNFLIALGTAALAGCANASQLVPSSRLHALACPLVSGGGGCGGGGLGGDLSGLTWQQIQALTTTQVHGLTGSQIATLTKAQVPVLTAAQVGVLHGSQSPSIFGRAAAVQQGATPPPTLSNPPPPPYVPSQPGSEFWSWFGGVVGGAVGGAVGLAGAGAVGAWFGGQLLAVVGSGAFGRGNPATFNFYNSNTGQWNSLEITLDPANAGFTSMNTDGFVVSGNFDASTNTVTITAIPN